MSAPLVLGAGQANCVALDVAANVATAARLVRRASAAGAELLVLPELFLTGHDLAAVVVEPAKYTVGAEDSRLDPLADACAETRTAAIAGAPVWEDGQVFNSLHVIGRGGQPAGRYDKQHLTAAERDAGLSPGEHGHTVTLDSWRIGLAIGADLDHTEHARAAARDGCLVYVISTRRPARVTDLLAERAADNGLFTVLAGHRDSGTGVWHPEGTLLAEAGTADPGLAVAELVRG
ncbi:carbon-nitrogen hydrolase family protein [Actinophytocola sediminis]